jgi:hypothetical protein
MKKSWCALAFTLLALAAVFGTASSAVAQEGDPPTRVARLNYVQGSISYQLAGEDDWVVADPNRPLTIGDNLWVDQNSRGEIHIGSTAIRLAPQTGISFLNLDDRTIQIQLAQGEIEVHLRRLEPGSAVEIDTPNLAFTPSTMGEYVIFADPSGTSTAVTIREGDGEVNAGGDSFELPAGRQYTFNGTDQVRYDAQPSPDFDDLENFSEQRDDRENRAASAQYVSRDIDGYYDLDDYGDWQNDPDYGAVWYPRSMFVGWAPYQDGHWVWINPWGWTWVDAQQWGFAPFHYGRWVYGRNAWGWVPGPLVVRPVYAPAVVGFVGGGGFGVSIGFGEGFAGVAWFPLGPRDIFIPSYNASRHYWNQINVTNTRIVTANEVTSTYFAARNNNGAANVHYTYQNNAAAVTAVSRETFVNARPVQHANVKINETQLASARVVDAAPLQPTRASYVASNAKPAARTAQPPVPFNQRKVVAKLQPPMPPESHNTPHVVNAQLPPSARPSTTTVETNRAALPDRPQPPQTTNSPAAAAAAAAQQRAAQPQTYKPEVFEEQNPPSAHENEARPATHGNSYNSQRQQNANSNGAPADQQHPAVKYAPPARANDQMYDVHPPLREQQQQQQTQAKPATQERANPPAQQKSAPPPASSAKPK